MKLTKERIERQSKYSDSYCEDIKKRIAAYEKDDKKEQRLSLRECKSYFYLNGIAGQAFTEYSCLNCNKKDMHPNTNVPKYCRNCSVEHQVCVRCAAKL